MAWGFFNKIKNGLKKAFNFGKKAVNFVQDKVLKPFKPAITTAVKTFVPGSAPFVDKTMDVIDKVNNFSNSGALGWGKSIG